MLRECIVQLVFEFSVLFHSRLGFTVQLSAGRRLEFDVRVIQSFSTHTRSSVLHTASKNYRYVLKWIRGKYERVAKSDVFRIFNKFGQMRRLDLIKFQCFKSASRMCMLD